MYIGSNYAVPRLINIISTYLCAHSLKDYLGITFKLF